MHCPPSQFSLVAVPKGTAPSGLGGHKSHCSASHPVGEGAPLQKCKSNLLLSFLAIFVASTKSFPSEFLKAKYPALHKALFNLYKISKGIIFLCIGAFVFVLASFLYFNYSLISTAPLLLPEVHFKAPKHELGAYKLQHESKQR